MISHGIAGFLKERMYDSSDGFRVHVCDTVSIPLFLDSLSRSAPCGHLGKELICQCGLMAIANLKKQEFHCSVCRNSTQISQVYLPYAAKLLFQELQAMNIA